MELVRSPRRLSFSLPLFFLRLSFHILTHLSLFVRCSTEAGPTGLEDVSTYPALIAELIKRGWEDKEIEALAGGNVLRIMEGVERVAEELKGKKASMGAYGKRKDLKRKF